MRCCFLLLRLTLVVLLLSLNNYLDIYIFISIICRLIFYEYAYANNIDNLLLTSIARFLFDATVELITDARQGPIEE